MDDSIRTLARFFREHPAWRDAGSYIQTGASSDVYFTHCPGERYHLIRRSGVSELLPGAAPDPDFVFRFTPGAIDRITALEGDASDFAVELFSLALGSDADVHVDLRIVSPLHRLARRGYVRLLLACGPKLLAFGARHGVRGLPGLRRLVSDLRRQEPASWEQTRSEGD